MSEEPEVRCLCSHEQYNHVRFTDDGEDHAIQEHVACDYCDCQEFRPVDVFSFPRPCRHPRRDISIENYGGNGPETLFRMICMVCHRKWFSLPAREYVGDHDVLQNAKDAFLEGKDDLAWTIISQAFEAVNLEDQAWYAIGAEQQILEQMVSVVRRIAERASPKHILNELIVQLDKVRKRDAQTTQDPSAL